MIKYLFLDLDNTILDFTKAESIAIRRTMSVYGLEPTDALAQRYSEVNDRHWNTFVFQNIGYCITLPQRNQYFSVM